ncbi:hypothetical protein SUGI_0877070 [Cryptomeria japonica]|nr:hypothetical protein SUGI_0877070 [Cryptomeria japonica]
MTTRSGVWVSLYDKSFGIIITTPATPAPAPVSVQPAGFRLGRPYFKAVSSFLGGVLVESSDIARDPMDSIA